MEATSLRTPARAFPDSHARNVGSEIRLVPNGIRCSSIREPALYWRWQNCHRHQFRDDGGLLSRSAGDTTLLHQRCLIACSSTNTPFRNRQKGPVYPYSKPTCTDNGADWVAPSKGCEGALYTSHGPYTYPTLSSPADATTASCNFSVLPASTTKPVTTGPAPTKVPGLNGVPGCAEVVIHQWGIESYSILSE